MVKLIEKYRGFIAYLFFGVFTTLVNMVTYQICYHSFKIPNVASTLIAWLLAVLFAFITNKMFVFDSKSWTIAVLKHEIPSFLGCRLLTGILDVVIMFVTVDMMGLNAMLWKLLSNVLVILLNYVASKLVIFKK